MHSASRLMLIDICMKFRDKSLSGFQVIERTHFLTDRQTGRCPGKNNMSPNPEGGRHNYCYTRKSALRGTYTPGWCVIDFDL